MTTMLSLILAFMLSIGGSPAASFNPGGCPGDTGIQAPIDNNCTINHFSEDYNQKTASRANSKKTGKTPSIKELETVNSIRFSRFSSEKLRQARYFDHKSYRFNSVDPVITKDEALSNPQLWNLYAYCRNNPITYHDPDGRSERDVRQIWDTYRNEVIRMTESGERLSSGKLNNIYNTFAIIFGGDEPYKNCVLQEQCVRNKLLENEYDDEWTFEPVESKFFELPVHTKGKARSKNPGDPEITYDPFNDEFCVYYSGEDRYEKFKNFSDYVKKTNRENSGKRVIEDKNDR